jgi:hypothetical protein
MEHGSTVPKNNHEKQHFAASPILRLGSKNQWALPSKIRFVSFTKHNSSPAATITNSIIV